MLLRLLKPFAGLFSLLMIVIIVALYLAVQFQQEMYRENNLTQVVDIDLNRGDSLKSLAMQLQQNGLTEKPEYFIWWVRLMGNAHHLQAGEYQVQPGQTLAALLNDMVMGNVRRYSLTLVDGWNVRQVIQAIQSNPLIQHSIEPMNNDSIMQAINKAGEHPEGRFFPDTYFIRKGEKDSEILLRAYQAMEKTLDELWQTRDPGLPFETPYQALILASIVEKESASAEERALIAGVFINRLRKNMRLQTDPTVIYGIGESYDGDIRYRDLRNDTPYNTYTRKGLPPTPIAMPGRGAIEAVMHPAQTDYLYFVARNDGSGTHLFSSTLQEHEKNVDEYQRHKK
jgi:peptidoglycan lytic transglycosylase G